MDNPLDLYLKRAKIKDDAFAALIGRDRSMVSKLRRGVVKPTIETASAIERHTNGEVPMQAWAQAAA